MNNFKIDNELLRQKNILSKEEILTKEGDLYVVKNVVTNENRIIEKEQVLPFLNENSQKKLLKG